MEYSAHPLCALWVSRVKSLARSKHIIANDVEISSNVLTQAMREKFAEAAKDFDAVLAPASKFHSA